MKKYAVHYEDLDDDYKKHIFWVKANNEEEAEQKCVNANPEANNVIDVVEEPEADEDLFVNL